MTTSHDRVDNLAGQRRDGASVAGPRATVPAVVLDQRPDADPEASRLITADQAIRLRAVPYKCEGRRVVAAMLDPEDTVAADELSILSGRPIARVGITNEAFAELLRTAYGITAAQMAARLGGPGADNDLVHNLEAIEADDLHRMAEQPSLINLVNLIILEAIRARASDIHIEPFERQLAVKYRIDGVLAARDAPPKQLQPAITSRIKIMGGMNIAERFAPQDGHITLRYSDGKAGPRKIDIRVSTVPTLYGESVVMRILDKESISLDLETLGMREPDRLSMQKLIDLPHGMVLVTGPTGSGKSTTLYAALSKLYDPSLKIITIEDPVEYELAGVNQIPVNPKRGLSFAQGLRSILRQDPDVIMVGEIRDAETAEISVRAALTGHLLFSTLHTNSAVSAPGRLLDMGIEPFLLSSVLEGVLGQRLGRRMCPHCRVRVPMAEHHRHRLSAAEFAMFQDGQMWKGRGCDRCDGVGARGRVGFYEIVLTTPLLRESISRRAGAFEIANMLARTNDFVTMRRDGMIKAAEGATTIDEVLRATQDAEELPAAMPDSREAGAVVSAGAAG